MNVINFIIHWLGEWKLCTKMKFIRSIFKNPFYPDLSLQILKSILFMKLIEILMKKESWNS